ncbi:MAG TPA: hypothetical protein VH184_10925, partial [Dongiaceae bacterium]|nr:hypothetical protein [Dongiaceae bacterium]
MKALVYQGPGQKVVEDRPKPAIAAPTDAIGRIDPVKLITHRFSFAQLLEAYDTFGHTASTEALKVIIE